MESWVSLDLISGASLTCLKLIETGRALRSSDKEGGRSFASASTRLRSFMPGAVENFHQALDELESDIVRASAKYSIPY
jgi:hypothetical protein